MTPEEIQRLLQDLATAIQSGDLRWVAVAYSSRSIEGGQPQVARLTAPEVLPEEVRACMEEATSKIGSTLTVVG